ncbi:hypothetical protein AV545_04090 [Paenibacillus jamilae]|uniref:GNAT family N-acetyltransferase n=1 Tax=Paenibacillus jamilae TaxID=114136 RepID=UPI0007AB8766|nr:hypothetical protein AV545_04090 [Paenibacillus jamilae]
MTEAVRCVADLAFRELGLHRIEANIMPRNEVSLSVVRVDVSRIVAFKARTIKRKSLLVAFMDDGNQYIML